LCKHAPKNSDDHDTSETASSVPQELSRCYSMLATAFHEMGAPPMAFKYWRLATETGEIEFSAIKRYLHLLAEQKRFPETLELFKSLQGRQSLDGYDRLVAFML
jgi:hypothetical protein